MNDLITIETLKAADVFKPGAVEKLISDVEQKVRAIPPADHTTEKGRNEIKALAYKVTRSKTALDDMGKTFVAELKKAAGVVDADRRIIRERLEALKDEVRAPVDQYEAEEAGRIAIHTHCMERLQEIDVFQGESTIAEIDDRLERLRQLKSRDWEEFSDGANRLIPKMENIITSMRARIAQQEVEKAELERLRKAEAERQEVERKANAKREQKARDERITAMAKLDAEASAMAAIARAEKAEAAIKAEAERTLAAERRRVADAKAAEEAATKKREANTKHLAKINNEALADLVKVTGIQEKMGKAVIVAIASGKISHVRIEY